MESIKALRGTYNIKRLLLPQHGHVQAVGADRGPRGQEHHLRPPVHEVRQYQELVIFTELGTRQRQCDNSTI